MVYIVLPGLQDEYAWCDFPCTEDLQLTSRSEGRHTVHFMPANDMKKSMFRHRKFPRLSLGSIPVPLVLEASALSTELPRYLKYVLLFTPGWSPAYLFEVVFVKCVCIWRTSVFFQFYGVLSGVIYNYSHPLPFLLLLFKVTLLQQRTVLFV